MPSPATLSPAPQATEPAAPRVSRRFPRPEVITDPLSGLDTLRRAGLRALLLGAGVGAVMGLASLVVHRHLDGAAATAALAAPFGLAFVPLSLLELWASRERSLGRALAAAVAAAAAWVAVCVMRAAAVAVLQSFHEGAGLAAVAAPATELPSLGLLRLAVGLAPSAVLVAAQVVVRSRHRGFVAQVGWSLAVSGPVALILAVAEPGAADSPETTAALAVIGLTILTALAIAMAGAATVADALEARRLRR